MSRNSIQKFKRKVKALWVSLRGRGVQEILKTLNPVLRVGRTTFRIGVAKRVFNDIDAWMFGRLRRYVSRMHPRKNWQWLKKRYFGKLHPREDKWV